MLVLRMVLCGAAILGSIVIANSRSEKVETIMKWIVYLLIATFSLVIITTNWNPYAIPKIILLLISCLTVHEFCLYGLFIFSDDYYGMKSILMRAGYILVTISYFVAIMIYPKSVTEYKNEEKGYWTLISVTDGTGITGSVSGSSWYVKGSISEEPEYVYYYKKQDGGIKQGRIPADKTTIYYIEEGQLAYLERIITETYHSYNSRPHEKIKRSSSFETTYNLYVPKGSVIDVYEFDTQ